MLTLRNAIICIAAGALLPLAFRASIGAGSDEGGATSHAVSVNAGGHETAPIPDFDGDGTVGFSDFLAFAGSFGTSQGDSRYEARFDLNGDGEIGFADFLIFAQNFGKEALPDDRGVLIAFYHATDGPNWVDSENWLTHAPLGDWYGVDTNGEGRVVRLDLLDNGLSGEIPPELGGLSKLDFLNLGGNNLSGPIPTELGNTSLGWMSLNGNDLSGPIPPELGSTYLGALYLRGNHLSGPIPPELGTLSRLTWLDLGANDLSGPIPPELGNLVHLKWLLLEGNRLEGVIPQGLLQLTWLLRLSLPDELCVPGTSAFVAWLRGMENRDDLDESLCNAADVAVLKRLYEVAGGADWTESAGWPGDGAVEEWHGVTADSLGRVTALGLSDNGLSGSLPRATTDLERLASLRIDGNPALSGRLPLSLASLPLRTLHYSGTGVCAPAQAFFRDWLDAIPSHAGTGVECPPLTDREILEVLYEATGGPDWVRNEKWATDAPLGEWHGVNVNGQDRVVRLDLRDNELTGRIPVELGSLANLESLDLHSNNLKGPIPTQLANLANLKTLLLSSNDLTGFILPELANLANLEWLLLHRSGLSGPIPGELGSLVKLRGLFLSENQLSGAIPAALGNLADLRLLNLAENELTGPIPVEFGNLSRLEELKLHLNGLVGSLPAELGGLAALRELHVSHNRLHGAVPMAFRGLTNLRKLTLGGNADMSGALPVGLAALDSLETLATAGTGLCAPSNAAFTEWLARLPGARVAGCGGMPAAAYLVQVVQSREFPIPLVAGEQALLRVFVTASQDNREPVPPVRATFHRDGALVHVAEIPAGAAPIPTELDEGSLAASANAVIPAGVVRPGLEMIVEIDPRGTLDPGLGVTRRIPEEGRLAVDVREMPVFELTVIPFLWSARPDSAILGVTAGMAADPDGHELLDLTRILLPVGDLDVTAHAPVSIEANHVFHVARKTRMIRALEGGGGYWMGMWSGEMRGAAGAGPDLTSTAWAYDVVIAHELGHNMTLAHAPCGGANAPDPAFPNRDGSIGAWGYDFGRGRLVPPNQAWDVMSYCTTRSPWISDYHFDRALRFRFEGEGAYASARITETSNRSLLLWGGVDAEGAPFLEPVFAVDAPPVLPAAAGGYRIAGRSAEGAQLFSFSFAMHEFPHGDGEASFAFVLPVRTGWETLSSVTLSGPKGAAILNGNSDVPMAILRDPVTGQVRRILRDLPRSAVAHAAAKIATGAQGLEVLFSRGIPDNLIPEPDDADTRR